ncbi:hypothetical protein A3740_06160, partial [Oleiphilus sp. HI0068]
HSLPKTLDPFKYADQNKDLQGHIAVHLMSRLTSMLVDSEGVVNIDLEFGRDEQRLRILKGKLSAELNLLCQRCLHPVKKTISSEFQLGIVMSDEQAQNLPRVYEPLLVEDEKLVLLDVIEEELILSLPMFAYHDDCEPEEYNEGDIEESVESEVEETKENPFSVLSELNLKK